MRFEVSKIDGGVLMSGTVRIEGRNTASIHGNDNGQLVHYRNDSLA